MPFESRFLAESDTFQDAIADLESEIRVAVCRNIQELKDLDYVKYPTAFYMDGINPATTYSFVAANYTGKDTSDDVVVLSKVPITQGALVRQNTGSLSFGSRLLSDKLSDFINPLDSPYNAKFDGTTDDSAALQAAINDSSSKGKPILLPGRTAILKTPLDLRNKAVDIRGAPGRTILKAGASMPFLINAEETADQYYNPFNMSDVFLDGNNLITNANISIRWRHCYELSNIWSFNTTRCFRERDCYLSRHRNLRTGTCVIAYHLEGSNHSSSYDACSAIGATQVGILIEANGAVADGNHGLIFNGCDVEFGDGAGVSIAANTSVKFNGCYIGEEIGAAIFQNLGGYIEVSGGIVFFGKTVNSYLFNPIGGRTSLHNCRIAGQTYGAIGYLSTLSVAQAQQSLGKWKITECDMYLITGGDPIFLGDVLDYGPKEEVFVSRLGRRFANSQNNTTTTLTAGQGDLANAKTVACTSVVADNPIIGLYAKTSQTDWRINKAAYVILVYRSTKPFSVRISNGILGQPLFSIGTVPASQTVATYVKVDSNIVGDVTEAYVELVMMNAAVGDFIELREIFFTDSSFSNNAIGQLGELRKC